MQALFSAPRRVEGAALHRQPRTALPHGLRQDGEGRGVRAVLDQPQPLGLQPAGPQGFQQIAQPLRPVDQGEAPAVFGQLGRRRAHVQEGTLFLHPGRTAGGPGAPGKIGGIGDGQIEGPGGQKGPHLPQIAGVNGPGKAVLP